MQFMLMKCWSINTDAHIMKSVPNTHPTFYAGYAHEMLSVNQQGCIYYEKCQEMNEIAENTG